MLQPHIISDRFDLPVWSCAGRAGSRFLIELRDNQRIMGLKCPKCSIVYVPPKSVCSKCYSQLDEWVEVSGEGTLTSYTVIDYMYSDYYQPKNAPYTIGVIRLDGADTDICHFLDEVDPSKLKVGLRVQAVFKEQRQASILDIDYFRVTP